MIYKTLKKVSEYCQILDKSKFHATQTINGVTFTNNGDGTITVNGTASKNIYFTILSDDLELSTHKKYLLTGCPSGGSSYTYFLYVDRDGALFDLDTGNGSIGTPTKSNAVITIFVRQGLTFNNLIFKPQLFDLTEMYGAGNEPTTVEEFRTKFPNELYDYKPYCFVKSYKSVMICKTKNLFPTSTAVGTLSGWSQSTARHFEEDKWYIGITANNYYEPSTIIEYELTGNYVYINTRGNSYGIGKSFKCEPNQTYTMTCKWVENTNYMIISIGFYDENGNYLSYDATSDEIRTFTTPANCKWFTVCFAGGTGGSSYVYNMQLEEGSTPTAFVPNGYIQSYKKSLICTTKNLFDSEDWYNTLHAINSTSMTKETVNGIEYYKFRPGGIWDYEYMKGEFKENTVYTLSFLGMNEDGANTIYTGFIFGYTDGTNIVVRIKGEEQRYTLTSSLNKTIDYIKLEFYVSKYALVRNIQLEEGSTATEYHPYGYL